MGTPIQCVAQGRVEYVDWLPGYGQCIIVDHGDGYYTLYAHASAIFPARGAAVHAGEVLGEVGDTGSLNGSQLYFEIRQGQGLARPHDLAVAPARMTPTFSALERSQGLKRLREQARDGSLHPSFLLVGPEGSGKEPRRSNSRSNLFAASRNPLRRTRSSAISSPPFRSTTRFRSGRSALSPTPTSTGSSPPSRGSSSTATESCWTRRPENRWRACASLALRSSDRRSRRPGPGFGAAPPALRAGPSLRSRHGGWGWLPMHTG